MATAAEQNVVTTLLARAYGAKDLEERSFSSEHPPTLPCSVDWGCTCVRLRTKACVHAENVPAAAAIGKCGTSTGRHVHRQANGLRGDAHVRAGSWAR